MPSGRRSESSWREWFFETPLHRTVNNEPMWTQFGGSTLKYDEATAIGDETAGVH